MRFVGERCKEMLRETKVSLNGRVQQQEDVQ